MPNIRTVLRWVFKDEAFRQQYAQARELQAELRADEIIDIADDTSEDEIFTEDGKRFENREFVNRSRLKIDARKWVAAKLLPKKYGERVDAEKPKNQDGLKELIDAIRDSGPAK